MSDVSMKPAVYFRTEGNENTGLGHLFRCLSLAEILQPEFTCTFILSEKTSSTLFNRINFIGVKVVYINAPTEQQEIEWIKSNIPSSSVIVIDSYLFSYAYFSNLLSLGFRTIYIDDQDKTDVAVYGVINHIIGSEKNQYGNVKAVQLLGAKYAILRKEFLNAKKRSDVNKNFTPDHILISLGGVDKDQITNKIVKNLLIDFPQSRINVLVGASFAGMSELKKLATSGQVDILKELNASEIIEAVSKTSIAIITPGMISYEFFSVGIPALCGYISEFQQDVVKQFAINGLVIDVADFNQEKLNFALKSITTEQANKQVQAQNTLFDGKSGDRLVKTFQKMYDRD